MESKTVANISSQAFAFCRYTLTLVLWAGFIWKIKALVAVVWVVLVLSALLGIRRAPLIQLYVQTVGRFIPSETTELDVKGMRFAHSLGAVFGAVCLLFLYGLNEPAGWWLTLVYCLIKTFSAIKACPAYKLYVCVLSGNGCCSFLRRNG